MDSAPEAFANFETGSLGLFGPEHRFCVPPSVGVRALPSYKEPRQYMIHDDLQFDGDTMPYITYPVPSSWQVEVTDEEAEFLRGQRYSLPQRGNRLSTVTDPQALHLLNWHIEWGARVAEVFGTWDLGTVGWKWKNEPKGLLQSFLDLARDDPHDPKTAEAVKKFALLWGPLWLCRHPRHFECYWSPMGGKRLGGRSPSPCLWAPVEEVWEFVRKAWQARAVVEAAGALRHKKAIPEAIRPYLYRMDPFATKLPDSYIDEPNRLRASLMNVIGSYLLGQGTAQGGPRLWPQWKNDQDVGTLSIHGGLGFIYSVWLEIFQGISDRHGFLQCDGCHKFYLRTKKRPAKGKKNFCEACGIRASKRESWRRRNWASY